MSKLILYLDTKDLGYSSIWCLEFTVHLRNLNRAAIAGSVLAASLLAGFVGAYQIDVCSHMYIQVLQTQFIFGWHAIWFVIWTSRYYTEFDEACVSYWLMIYLMCKLEAGLRRVLITKVGWLIARDILLQLLICVAFFCVKCFLTSFTLTDCNILAIPWTSPWVNETKKNHRSNLHISDGPEIN